MEVKEGSCAVYSDIQRLPEECISHAISLTTPRDACRSEAVSAAFQTAAISDNVWKSFLPADYAEFLARSVDQVEFTSMKQLYFRICDPILIDGGKMGFFVDRETGAKCFILPARELGIVWGDTPEYWSWTHHPESRFSEVAELQNVCWLEIHGRINSRMLSKRSNYSAHLIFKLSNTPMGLSRPLQEASVAIGAHASISSVRLMPEQEASSRPFRRPFLRRPWLGPPRFFRPLTQALQDPPPNHQEEEEEEEDAPGEAEEPRHDPPQDQTQGVTGTAGKPRTRPDGWMEILLGEFFNEEGDEGEIDASLSEIKGGNWKTGLIVQGIEIRPARK